MPNKSKQPLLRELQAKAEIVLVTGDRHWDNPWVIARELARCTNMEVLIQGGAPGADGIAKDIGEVFRKYSNFATLCEFQVLTFKANWNKLGRAAGPIRNKEMKDRLLAYKAEGKSVFVLAFHSEIHKSKGTKDMLKQASKAGIPVLLIIE